MSHHHVAQLPIKLIASNTHARCPLGRKYGELIGYARISTQGQETDILAAGRRDDLYSDEASGRQDTLPRTRSGLQEGDTLVVATLDSRGKVIVVYRLTAAWSSRRRQPAVVRPDCTGGQRAS